MISLIQFSILIFCVANVLGNEEAPLCPQNEHYTTCVNACPTPTCADPRPPSCQFLVCNKGCECDEGYVRVKKPNGGCIPIERCKKCLRKDFKFNECGSQCNNTCEDILNGPQVCPAVCVPGCYCKKGVYDEQSDKCIPKEQCKKCQGN